MQPRFLKDMWSLKTIRFWAATALASLAVLLVIMDGWLVTSNAGIRGEVNARQQFINQSVQLSQVFRELLNDLGGFAIRNNNAAIRQLLAESGFTVVGPQAQGQPAPGATGQVAPAPANPATPVPLKKP
jgi:hypothetical protein